MNQLLRIVFISTSFLVTTLVHAADAARAAQQIWALKEQEGAHSYQILIDTSQPGESRNKAQAIIERYAQEKIPHVLFLKSELLKEGLEGFYSKDEKKAIQLCKDAANLGDLGACWQLADYYQKGSYGIRQDSDKAIQLYEKILNYVAKNPGFLDQDQLDISYYKVAFLYTEKAETANSAQKPLLYKKAQDRFSHVQGALKPYASFSIGSMLEKNQIQVDGDKKAKIKEYYTQAFDGFNAIQELPVIDIRPYIQLCMYFFDLFKESDPQKAVEYLDKGLVKNPDDLVLHDSYWLLYKNAEEDIDFEKAFKHLKFVVDATAKKFKEDPNYMLARTQALFDYATIVNLGIYGIKQDKKRAQQLFNQILQREHDDFVNELDWTAIGLMYEFGLGVPRDLNEALRYYKKLSPVSRQDLVTDLEKKITEEKRKKTLASQAGALTINDQPTEEDDFEFLPPAQEDTQPLKSAEINHDQTTADLIHYFNTRHPMDDNSTVTAIDVPSKKITINDIRNNLEITLDAGQKYADIPFDVHTLVRKKIRKLIYDNRIKPWFTQDYNGDDHFFAQMVDALIQVYGITVPFSRRAVSGNKTFILDGSIQEVASKKIRHGQFEYGFYKEKNSDRWILYHRLFRPFNPFKKSY